ncbi:unnamed protein product [Parajaminaea phylloscopi]
MSGQQASQTNILVVGAGAVGCFYASKLHHPEQNVHVSLVCRSNYKAIAANGVQLKTRDFGDYHFRPRSAYPSIDAAGKDTPPSGWDIVIVTTKALPDRVDDAKSIEPLVTPGRSVIALIQNGVGIEEPHRARFPQNPIVSCVTVISAEQVEHGVIVQNRWTRVSMGPYTDGVGDDQASDLARRGNEAQRRLAQLWSRGGIKDAEPHTEKELQLIRWHKLTINAAFNPSAVLCGGRGNASMVLDDKELRRHIEGCMSEIFAVAPRVLNVANNGGFPAHLATPERIVKSTERNSRSAKPSMLLDWEASRPMELEVILGNPVRIARSRGYDMPRLQTMYALLKSAQVQREQRQKVDREKSKL